MSQSAVDSLSRTLKVNPKHTIVRTKRAHEYLLMKKYAHCLKDCQKVLVLDECNVRCMIYKAACHLVMGDREEAVELLLEARTFADSDEFYHQLSEFREWDSFVELTDPDFIPEGKICRKTYMREKTEPSWDDKVTDMLKRANFGYL